jgi:hypothetical protein
MINCYDLILLALTLLFAGCGSGGSTAVVPLPLQGAISQRAPMCLVRLRPDPNPQ